MENTRKINLGSPLHQRKSLDAPKPGSLTSAYKAPHFYDVNFLVILAITIVVLDQSCQERSEILGQGTRKRKIL